MEARVGCYEANDSAEVQIGAFIPDNEAFFGKRLSSSMCARICRR